MTAKVYVLQMRAQLTSRYDARAARTCARLPAVKLRGAELKHFNSRTTTNYFAELTR